MVCFVVGRRGEEGKEMVPRWCLRREGVGGGMQSSRDGVDLACLVLPWPPSGQLVAMGKGSCSPVDP